MFPSKSSQLIHQRVEHVYKFSVRIACSRRSDSGARAKKKASERAEKTRGDWGRGRGNACEIFKKLVTVYQNLVYPLIGQI